MKGSVGKRTWFLDCCGGALLAGIVGAAAWLALVQGRETRERLDAAGNELLTRRRDLGGLQAVVTKQRAILTEREKQLAQTGRLPDETPTEEYFEHLSQMANRHGLRILRHSPLPPQEYPGLREDRFAFDLVGPFPDLVAFFRDIESSPYWADVSYLRVASASQGDEAAKERVASLTLSLFSAKHESAAVEPG